MHHPSRHGSTWALTALLLLLAGALTAAQEPTTAPAEPPTAPAAEPQPAEEPESTGTPAEEPTDYPYAGADERLEGLEAPYEPVWWMLLPIWFCTAQPLLFVLAIILAVHAVRTGRPVWWVLILIFAPVLGSLIYFFAEVLPDIRQGRFSFGGSGRRGFERGKPLIRRLEAALERADTTDTRVKLGDAYVAAGRFEDAIATYAPCRDGRDADDPYLLIGLARAYVETRQWAEATVLLAELGEECRRDLRLERQLLAARAAAGRGEVDAAINDLRSLQRRYTGEEPRVRCALLLDSVGRHDEARALYTECIEKIRRSPRIYRQQNARWRKAAKQGLSGKWRA
jgi:hypothetical protein